MKLTFNNINPNKLHDELILNGIIPILVQSDLKEGEYISENTWITFEDDVDVAKVNEIVAKHEPTTITQKTEIELLKEAVDALVLANLGV